MATKISNLIGKSRKALANQFVIQKNGITLYQSYKTKCAMVSCGIVFLNYNYFGETYNNGSPTTIRNLYLFLNEYSPLSVNGKKDILKYIKDKRIVMKDSAYFEIL